MSHFYGVLQGSRGQATRCGTKGSGMNVTAASWNGAINVYVYHDEKTGEDRFSIHEIPWHGRGNRKVIASGVLGEQVKEAA